MKLELKHLAPYLPYSITAYGSSDIWKIISCGKTKLSMENGLHLITADLDDFSVDYDLILRPFSDLKKEIEFDGEKITPIEYFEEKYYTLDLHKQCLSIIEDDRWLNHCDYLLIQHLLEWHFDIFGLIENGLAIDINTL